MRVPRFFTPDLPLSSDELTLDEAESTHALRVLRLKSGARIELFDGQGGAANAEVCATRKRAVLCRILERHREERPAPQIEVYVPPPKGRRMPYLLEKLTELGVAKITPLTTARSELTGSSGDARPAWRRRLIEAAKQCHLPYLPSLGESRALQALPEPPELGLFGALFEGAPALNRYAERCREAQTISLVIGPEGGFTDSEQGALLERGYSAARLGGTVLRLETAAVALVAAALALGQRT
jgi:16S rRNA (uracil1498-N3)-methyltransferase